MSYQFAKIEFYSTLKVGTAYYTESGIHRCAPQPTPDSSVMVADIDVSTSPKNANLLSVLDVPIPEVPGTTTQYDLAAPLNTQPSFMMITTSSNQHIYGWIDDIVMVTHAAPNSSYRIRWHVDWWLTAGHLAAFGPGRMLRGPVSYARPDPGAPRKWEYSASDKVDIHLGVDGLTRTVGNVSDPWVIIAHTYEGEYNGKTYTRISYKFWQPDVTYTYATYNRWGPGWADVFNGGFDEMLELDPDSIIGCWVSPIPPSTGNGIVNYRIPSASQSTDGISYWTFTTNIVTNTKEYTIISYVSKNKTDDGNKWIVSDPYGNTMGTLPWGIEWNHVYAGLDLSTAAPMMVISFNDDTLSTIPRIGEGRTMTIPLMSLPVTSNAWSSYNYSGEREYDKTMRHIQQEQNAVSGIAGAAQGAMTGAMMGAISGAAGGPIGLAAGTAIGLGSSLISTGINYSLTGKYDAKTQEAIDRLKSNQTSNILIPGGGVAWMKLNNVFNPSYTIARLTRDSVSAAELTAEQSELGYLTDTYVANCATLISAKGPLRIEGLQVYGLSPEGNRYISTMFARGVHLD